MPEIGRSAASPSDGSSLSGRLERALLSMFLSLFLSLFLSIVRCALGASGYSRRNWCRQRARFGRKALLVLLYPTGWPFCAGPFCADLKRFGEWAKARKSTSGWVCLAPGFKAGLGRQANPFQCLFWALNSAVECHLHTVEVAGSNPAAPTIQPRPVPGAPLRLSSPVCRTLLHPG